tara:strand:- start:179 stop:637 length:459 start_codon:yes stop_codon:yes gene_type:complete
MERIMPVGAMIPDWGFRKELKRLDPKLDVKWDTGRGKWKIVRETAAPGNLYNYEVDVMTVCTNKGEYQSLDMRTIRLLRMYDTHTRGADTVIDEMMETQVRDEQQLEKAEASDMESIVSQELMPSAAKDASSLNAMNIPKEDVAALMEPRRG